MTESALQEFIDSNENNNINIGKLIALIEKGEHFLSEQITQAIIVIGSTGSGKSVLINLAVGKKLIILTNPYNPEKVAIELADGEKGLKIGHNSAISETSVPEYIIDDKTKIGYFDCPGFGDTKCDEQEIANAIFIKRIFEKVANVKIILVAQQEEFTSTVGRGGLIISFINQLINMFYDVNELTKILCLVVTKVEAQFNNRTRQFIEPSLEQIIDKLRNFKELHQKSNDSQIFSDQNFAKVFDTFLIKERVEIFLSPTGKDGELIDYPQQILQMINKIPYVKSPKINSSITPQVKLKLQKFYVNLHQHSIEQSLELKKSIENYLLKSQNFEDILKLKMLILQLLQLKNQFDIINPKELPDEVKSAYKAKRKELQEFIQLKPKNTIDILKLIDFISVAQLPSMKMSEFLFIEIENLNNNIYKEINAKKNNFIENFYQITCAIKQIMMKYFQNIEDESILEDLKTKLLESLEDNIAYLSKYSEILLKTIQTQQIKQRLNELQQNFNLLQNIFEIMKKSDESIGAFPVDAIKNALAISFLDIDQKIYELRQIKRDKENQLAIEQCQAQFQQELISKENAFNEWKDQQNKIAKQIKLQREQEIANLKTEAEKNQARLQQQIEEQNRQAEIQAEKEKKEMELKLVEIKKQAEIEAIKYNKSKKEQEELINSQSGRLEQLQRDLEDAKRSRGRRHGWCIIF